MSTVNWCRILSTQKPVSVAGYNSVRLERANKLERVNLVDLAEQLTSEGRWLDTLSSGALAQTPLSGFVKFHRQQCHDAILGNAHGS